MMMVMRRRIYIWIYIVIKCYKEIITSSICIMTRFNICTEAFQEVFDKSEWVHPQALYLNGRGYKVDSISNYLTL